MDSNSEIYNLWVGLWFNDAERSEGNFLHISLYKQSLFWETEHLFSRGWNNFKTGENDPKSGGREMPLQNGRLPPKTGGLRGLLYATIELRLNSPIIAHTNVRDIKTKFPFFFHFDIHVQNKKYRILSLLINIMVTGHFVPCPLRNLPLRTRKLPARTNVPSTSYQKATSSYQRTYHFVP